MRRLLLSQLIVLPILGSCGGDDSGDRDPMVTIDASVDAPDADINCTGLNSVGGFADCSVCEAAGRGCDTLDVDGTTMQLCDCQSSSDCPCGLGCGRLEVAPGVYVSSICTQ